MYSFTSGATRQRRQPRRRACRARGCSSTAVFRKNRAGGMVNVKVHHQQTTFNKCGPSANLCHAPPATMARGAPCRHWRDTRARAQVTTSGVLPSTIRSCSPTDAHPNHPWSGLAPVLRASATGLWTVRAYSSPKKTLSLTELSVRSRRLLHPPLSP